MILDPWIMVREPAIQNEAMAGPDISLVAGVVPYTKQGGSVVLTSDTEEYIEF